MRLEIDTYLGLTSAVARCRGDIVFRNEADHLHATVRKFDRQVILLDVEQVVTIDAYGIGRMLELLHRLRGRDREFLLVHPSHRLQELLRLTKLYNCLTLPYRRTLTTLPEVTRNAQRSESPVVEVSELFRCDGAAG